MPPTRPAAPPGAGHPSAASCLLSSSPFFFFFKFFFPLFLAVTLSQRAPRGSRSARRCSAFSKVNPGLIYRLPPQASPKTGPEPGGLRTRRERPRGRGGGDGRDARSSPCPIARAWGGERGDTTRGAPAPCPATSTLAPGLPPTPGFIITFFFFSPQGFRLQEGGKRRFFWQRGGDPEPPSRHGAAPAGGSPRRPGRGAQRGGRSGGEPSRAGLARFPPLPGRDQPPAPATSPARREPA